LKCVLAVSNHLVTAILRRTLCWVNAWCVASVWAMLATLHQSGRILQILCLLYFPPFPP